MDRQEARPFIQAMAKHLPPSASTLRLADVEGASGDVLREMRADLNIMPVFADAWIPDENSVDAVTIYETALSPVLLSAALRALRPGGRLIAVYPDDEPHRDYVDQLEAAGYTRILVEAAVEDRAGGVLVRGEKPHTTADTLARVNSVAQHDSAAADLTTFRGRYVHLLVRQTPNKPVWALTPDDQITWQAIGVEAEGGVKVLAFSSLPNAVAFMQAAVLAGTLRDVNKVGKFSRKTAEAWTFRVVLNPSPDVLHDQQATTISIDPSTAETPDE